VKNEVE
jgi:hypothetical protein